ncbi:MAG TPA: thermonuclease family protein [Bosea sp. (in: a-proteobacteria)]|nr:thermonuclease family protein [Bosea sp. (in: a-proteobacteria)]
MARFGFRTSNYGPFGWRRVGRSVDFVVALGFLLLLAIAGAVLQYRLGPSRSLAGAAEAIDGDSLRLLGEELRLEGIDAPEYRQSCRDRNGSEVACGRQARRALAAMLALGTISCTVSRADRYGRGLARCQQGDAEINAALVRQGNAVSYGAYQAEEAEAKAAGRGLWALSFERPEEWRRSHPR